MRTKKWPSAEVAALTEAAREALLRAQAVVREAELEVEKALAWLEYLEARKP